MHTDTQLARSTRIERFFQSRLRLGQLRLLVAIADLGQLKRVAAAMHVTPPAISKQVNELEEALGEALLVRVGNRLAFTPLGELLARRARELLAQIERTRADVDRLCSGMSGRMAIGAVPTVAPLLLPELVLTLKQRAPGVSCGATLSSRCFRWPTRAGWRRSSASACCPSPPAACRG